MEGKEMDDGELTLVVGESERIGREKRWKSEMIWKEKKRKWNYIQRKESETIWKWKKRRTSDIV